MLGLHDLLHPLPSSWNLLTSIDTGTYMSASITLFPPESFDAFTVFELPNYRYVGGEIELIGDSVPEWSRKLMEAYRLFRPGHSRLTAFCDENSQFKTELSNYGINAIGNSRKLELRVEISREYFQNGRIHLAPWLSVLPYELEHATWPDHTSSAGKFERLKVNDHTLDTLEHTLSRRPRHKSMVRTKKPSLLEQHLKEHRWRDESARTDPHLGSHN